METNALDMRIRPPKLRWSSDSRKFLCCMVKYFEKDHSGFQAVFNACFRKELAESGFKEDEFIGWPALNSQWTHMKSRGDPIWEDIHQADSDPEAVLSFIQVIEDTAVSIGHYLDRKPSNSVGSSKFTTPVACGEKNARRQLFQTESSPIVPPRLDAEPGSTDDLFSITTSQQDVENAPSLAEPAPAPVPLCRAGIESCFWCYTESLNKKATEGMGSTQLPPLLYRWWNVKSQGLNLEGSFVAGMFAGLLRGFFEPYTITDDEFSNLFESHIRREQTPSPFISTFQSLLAPVHRGLREGKGASIAIYDSRKITSKAYSAHYFVREHKLLGKIGRTYHGGGEYLVWGQINSDAVICSFEVAKLSAIAAEHPDIHQFLQLDLIASHTRARRPLHNAMTQAAMFLDKKAGATVGKILSFLEVPQEFCRIVSESMAYSWRVKNKRIPWRDFFEGVELGFRGEPVMTALRRPDTTLETNADIPSGEFDSDLEIIDISSDDEGDDSDGIIAYPNEDDRNDKDAAEAMEETPSPSPRRDGIAKSSCLTSDNGQRTQPFSADSAWIIIDSSDDEMPDVVEPCFQGT
ncbi:hypothetical protein BDW74DRAFT_177776 [Aspergillus multicolor]|uniref:uncharacterized protein n=1 Tax=Aspergillus multicolor TaxID=41759 RepID=UPI003CCDE45D